MSCIPALQNWKRNHEENDRAKDSFRSTGWGHLGSQKDSLAIMQTFLQTRVQETH